MVKLILVVALALSLPGGALAQQPCVIPRQDLVSPSVRAVVRTSGTGLEYEYVVSNKGDAQQRLVSFAVEAVTTPPPIQASPSAWEAGGAIRGSGWYVWDTFVEPTPGIPPGTSIGGFRFITSAPPSVGTFLAWGDVELPTYPDGGAPESCEGSDIIQNSFKGTTIGPKTSAVPFVAIESLNHLIALLHESRRQGWVLRDGVHKSMLTKLTSAKRRLEANDPAGARSNLNAFLGEVSGASCEDFDCPGNQPATSEAYGLLYFSGKYILDRLP